MIHYDYQPKVYLDTIEEADFEVLRGWRNDYRIRRWCRQIELISLADELAWIDYQNDAEDMTMLKILDASKMIVGVCGLTDINMIHRRAEISCYIAPSKQRKGLGLAAIKSIMRHGFDDLNLRLIWGEAFAGSPAIALAEDLGMSPDGTRRDFYWKDGKYCDAVLYSITSDEFEKTKVTGFDTAEIEGVQ